MEAEDGAVRGIDPAPAANHAVWCVACVLMLGLLLAPALWNGFPLLQHDSGGYLARWYEGYLVPSRPAAYGLLLAATTHVSFWPVVVLQAAATSWILALLLRELGLGRRPLLLLAVVAVLTFATTLPWLTSILLTDTFAGLAVLALHLLVFGRTPGPWGRRALTAFVALAAATHSATLALLGVLAAGAMAAALLTDRVIPARGGRRAGIAVVLGVTVTLGANAIVAGYPAFTPGGFGILFGRLLQDGIVSRYLRDHCPDVSLKLCPHRGEIPLDADAFLWGNSVFNRLGRFAGLGDEMRTIVLGSLRDYPLLQAETAAAATVSQLGKVATGEGVINQIWHTYGIIQRYTPEVVPAMRAARQQHRNIDFAAINRVHVPVALMAMALLPILLTAGARWPELGALRTLAATILLALLANAFLCGALSNPHDRYGARLIWLAPLIMLLVPILAFRPELDGLRRRWTTAWRAAIGVQLLRRAD